MPHRKLIEIKERLECREIPLSDALLMVLRCLRGRVEESRLAWLNRELLGYCEEDLELFRMRSKSLFTNLLFWARRDSEMAAPQYRFLTGTWGRVEQDGRFIPLPAPLSGHKQVFCNIGIQQLEVQLYELACAQVKFFNVTVDPATGAEFYCSTSEMQRVADEACNRLCNFITTVVHDLEITQL